MLLKALVLDARMVLLDPEDGFGAVFGRQELRFQRAIGEEEPN